MILADVGGFFNNPDPELLVRWYQVRKLFFTIFSKCYDM